MNCKKSCIIIAASTIGTMIALVSSAIALCMFEEKADICYMMKRKAKKALKHVENKIDDKLDC